MPEEITLSEADLRRMLAQAQAVGAQQHERERRRAEAEAHHHEAMARALEWGDWVIPEDQLRALMARGRHHELCRYSRGFHRDCTCGIAVLAERDREAGDAADELAGYGLV